MGWLTGNAGLKLVSLGLAILTWFFVNNITSDRREIEEVPLEVKVKPGMIAQTDVPTVSVTVRGIREDVRQVSRQDLAAAVDATREESPVVLRVRLGRRQIRHPPRVQVVHVKPASVTVRILRASSIDTVPEASVQDKR